VPETMIQGWCPGALRPMLSGDGWVVRVRPRGGRLSQVQADGIGRLALAHGNGQIDLSSRANLQIRGTTEQTFAPLLAGLDDLDLLDQSAEAEARRNIVVSPFWAGRDPTQTLSEKLADALSADDAPNLPSKFGFAVDCGPTPVLAGVSADIRLERSASGGLVCRADGATSGAAVSEETAVPSAMALAAWFLQSGGVHRGRGRMASHLAAGAVLPRQYAAVPAQITSATSIHLGRVEAGVLVAFEFGQLSAETLVALAQYGALRMTPWRMLLIEGVNEAPAISGLITRATDPMLRVSACSGKPACSKALQPTRDMARLLAPQLPDGATLHVSGCAKGCALAGTADMTLTAQLNGFDVIRGGRADGVPHQRGLTASWLSAHAASLNEVA
jgi:precorrin-3B synthase